MCGQVRPKEKIMEKMLQLEKLDGVGNVQMVEADVPSAGPARCS